MSESIIPDPTSLGPLEVVIASKNPAKVQEIIEIMAGLPIKFVSAEEVGDWPDIEESGQTYLENAFIKAAAVCGFTGKAVLADDSGIEVDALDGRPGVRSARFAGAEATDEQNNVRLASLLHGVPAERRTARYRCVALMMTPARLDAKQADGAAPQGENETVFEIGTCEGSIALEPKGTGGFGYDPWFIPEGETRTMAELTAEEKHVISHRGKAFRGLRRQMEEALEGLSAGDVT